MIGIYSITNKMNEKQYIGLSMDIERRWKEHVKSKSNSLIHQAILKYGQENFSFEVLEECDEDMLETREEYWIELHQTHLNGYNLTPGGNRPVIHYGEKNPGAVLSDKQIDEIYQILQTTNRPYSDIAKNFGVWASSIGRIDKGLIRSKTGYAYPLRKNHSENLSEKADSIIDLLKNSALTHKEIAEKLQVAKSTVTMINIGRNHFDPESTYPVRKQSPKSLALQNRNIQIIHLLETTSLSQVEISKRFNVSPQTVTDIRKGRRGKIEGREYPINRPKK